MTDQQTVLVACVLCGTTRTVPAGSEPVHTHCLKRSAPGQRRRPFSFPPRMLPVEAE